MNAKQLQDYLTQLSEAGKDLSTLNIGVLSDVEDSQLSLLMVSKMCVNGSVIVIDVGLQSAAKSLIDTSIKQMPKRHKFNQTRIDGAVKSLLSDIGK